MPPIVAIIKLRKIGAVTKSFASRRFFGGRTNAAMLPAHIAPPHAITSHASKSSPRNIVCTFIF
jgi:hypothetical protein